MKGKTHDRTAKRGAPARSATGGAKAKKKTNHPVRPGATRRPPREAVRVPLPASRAKKGTAAAKALSLFTLTACALLLGFDLLFEIPAPTLPAFKGYDTVLYRGARPLSEVAAFMQKQPGIEAVVSRATAEVLYTDFSGLAVVPLGQVAKRFDALDPRYDEYMKQLGRYFTFREGGSRWDVLYVATSHNSLSLSLILNRIEGTGPADWILDESGREGPIVIVALLGTVFFFALFSLSRRSVFHLLAAAGILPWLHALAGSGSGVFVLFFPVAAAWCFFMREFISYCDNEIPAGRTNSERRPLLVRLGLFGGMLIVATGCAAFGTGQPALVALAVLCQAAAAAAYWTSRRLLVRLKAYLKKKARSKSFTASPLLAGLGRFEPGPHRSPGKDRGAVHAVVVILCLAYPILLMVPASSSVSFPVPRPVAPGLPVSMSSIRRLSEAKSADSLPDLSDFVRHAAFQERLAYERRPAYAIPAPGEGIVLSEYGTDPSGGEVMRSEKKILSFDDDWLRGLEKRAGRSSIARMLFAQGQCLSVVFARETRVNAFGEGNWTILVIFSIVLIPLLLLQYTPFPDLVYGKRKSIRPTGRKKR